LLANIILVWQLQTLAFNKAAVNTSVKGFYSTSRSPSFEQIDEVKNDLAKI
jgi:hypothetical protein